MTVMVNQSSKRFHGSGSAGPFTWTWRFLANTDIKVYRVADPDEEDPSTEVWELLVDGDYLLSGDGSYTGGSLMLAAPLVDGEDLVIERRTEVLQPVSIRNQGSNFLPGTHEDVFDRLTMMIQDRERDVDTNTEYISGLRSRLATAEDRIFDLEGRPDNRGIRTVSDDYQVVKGDRIIYIDASANDVTVTLMESVDIDAGDLAVKRRDDSGYMAKVVAQAGDQLEDGDEYPFESKWSGGTFRRDGVSTWSIF